MQMRNQPKIPSDLYSISSITSGLIVVAEMSPNFCTNRERKVVFSGCIIFNQKWCTSERYFLRWCIADACTCRLNTFYKKWGGSNTALWLLCTASPGFWAGPDDWLSKLLLLMLSTRRAFFLLKKTAIFQWSLLVRMKVRKMVISFGIQNPR